MKRAVGVTEVGALVLLAVFVLASGSGATLVDGWAARTVLFVLPIVIASGVAYGLYRIGRRLRPDDEGRNGPDGG